MTDSITITLLPTEGKDYSMKKYEVELSDEQFLAVSDEFNTHVWLKRKDGAFEGAWLHPIRAAQAPSYTRVQVLRGQWEPNAPKENYWLVSPKRGIVECANFSIDGLIAHKEQGSLAPTPELAEELSQVIAGIWKPRIGDSYYFCFEDGHISNPNEIVCEMAHSNWDEKTRCFPSKAQRATFIKTREAEQAKKEEPKKAEGFELIEGKRFYASPEDGIGFGSEVSGFMGNSVSGELNVMRRKIHELENFCREKGGTF